MPVLVSGEDRVRKLQQALGGQPPAEAHERAVASINQFLADRRTHNQKLREQQAALQREAAELFFGHLKDDPRLSRLTQRSKAIAEEKAQRKHPFRPVRCSAETAVIFGSDIWVKAPPYENRWKCNGPG
jgi:hypothetical protein